MTREARQAETPRLDGQAGLTSRATTRAGQGYTLADLCNDGAGGHPAQRVTITRTTGGTFHAYYKPTDIGRFLVIRACVVRAGTYSFADAATFVLSIDDVTGGSIPAGDPLIPEGLNADVQYVPIEEAGGRFAVASYQSWALDLNDLKGVLSSTDVWRFNLVIACDATVACELVQFEEVSRFAVDTADSFGELPQDYLPRGAIIDGAHGTTRLLATMRAGHYLGVRTYHQRCMPQSAPWSTTSTTWAALNGDVETGTTPMKWGQRTRKMRGAAANGARVGWIVMYRITGASLGQKAQIRLNSGGTSSPYVLDLADISGSWADSTLGDGWLATNLTGSVDKIFFEARTDAGTLEICTRDVFDTPA